MSDDLVTRLRRLDACAVSDALDRLSIDGQVSAGLEQRATNRRIAGRVVTYRLDRGGAGAAARRPDPPPRHDGHRACAAPATSIVVEQRTGVEAGCWGGILTLGAKVSAAWPAWSPTARCATSTRPAPTSCRSSAAA